MIKYAAQTQQTAEWVQAVHGLLCIAPKSLSPVAKLIIVSTTARRAIAVARNGLYLKNESRHISDGFPVLIIPTKFCLVVNVSKRCTLNSQKIVPKNLPLFYAVLPPRLSKKLTIRVKISDNPPHIYVVCRYFYNLRRNVIFR